MSLGFLKPISGTMRLRYVRPGNGYDANDLTLAGNKVAFDSANAGIFSIFAQGLWRGSPPTSRTKIISWPTLSYIPICTIELNSNGGSYSDRVDFGFYIPEISGKQYASGTYGLEIGNDGIYWQFNGGGSPDHSSVWWWAHRMPAQ